MRKAIQAARNLLLAHDVNNMRAVVNGYCDGSRRKNLEIIRQAGEPAAGLTQQLLAFSRKQLTRTEAVNVNPIAAEVAQLSRRLIGENIRVVEDLCEDGGTIMADAAQIHQMLMNQVINARDAMPDGGLLVVRTSAEGVGADLAGQLDIPRGAYVALAVADSGQGMDDFVRARIFERFFTTKSAGKGAGLGLSTVYGAVRQSGGGITVEPLRRRKHTSHVPSAIRAARGCRPAQRPDATLLRGARTVLVVEDEDDVRRFIVDLLRGAGYAVLEVAGAEEALAIGARHSEAIHLLLTDMVMPGMNGRKRAETLCKFASRVEGGAGVRLFGISGFRRSARQEHSIFAKAVYSRALDAGGPGGGRRGLMHAHRGA